MWVKEDGFTEREEHRGRRRGPEGTAGLESRLFRQRLRPDQTGRGKTPFCHSERRLRSEESAFSLAFCKSRSLASLGMTTNCDSSTACKSRALPKIASGVRARRPRGCGASESKEAKARSLREAEGKFRAPELSQKAALDNQVAAADRMARKVWGATVGRNRESEAGEESLPRPLVGTAAAGRSWPNARARLRVQAILVQP
jgi:hypothetical protein